MEERKQRGLISIFCHHPVAANMLMVMLILSGIWALGKINTQFFPSFSIQYATATITWSGATAEDVERLISIPVEQEFRNLRQLKKLESISSRGVAVIIVEFSEDANMRDALDEMKDLISQVPDLPADADEPAIAEVVRYEHIASLIISGPESYDELRHLSHRYERELIAAGIAKINIAGLPPEEIVIEVENATLRDLRISLPQLAKIILDSSQDIPAGVMGHQENLHQLRIINQRRDSSALAQLPISIGRDSETLLLDDIAEIEQRLQSGSLRLFYQGKPAVILHLKKTEQDDSLEAAEIFAEWLAQTQSSLPPEIHLKVHDERWHLIRDRLGTLVDNGLSGLLLVLIILFLFFSPRVGLWVSIGIPISFFGTLAIFYLYGGSINMISMFGFIMSLGIVVDDAIVVGENAYSRFQQGATSLHAADQGAQTMLGPVLASSLTTIAAFLPLILVGGNIGTILREIPIVVICVIVASLVECFLILPGHLRASMNKSTVPGKFRLAFDNGFATLRDVHFRKLMEACIEYRWSVLASAVLSLTLALGILINGHLKLNFFPAIEGDLIYANVDFTTGTPSETVEKYLRHLEITMAETEEELGSNLVQTAIVRLGANFLLNEVGQARQGDQYGSIILEMTPSDQRDVSNKTFIAHWEDKVSLPAGLDNLAIASLTSGPPIRDLEIILLGQEAKALKQAANELKAVLTAVPGVQGVEDNLAYGPSQIIFSLTPFAQSLGLHEKDLATQLHAAYDGIVLQTIAGRSDSIDIRLLLSADERNHLNNLEDFSIALPDGGTAPLGNLVEMHIARGFESLRHRNGSLAVTITGNVAPDINPDDVLATLQQGTLTTLEQRYGVEYTISGKSGEQEHTLIDMQRGAILALLMIYLILAWVFGSYGWPLVVLFVIPFGLVGAVIGHLLLDLPMTILSLFGFFGLSGIVVNDSIILIIFYKKLKNEGVDSKTAVVQAVCQRLRAVLLTSLTTIGGLTPLLFNTSLQAQFIIPMATTLVFGLFFATFLVLFVIPSLLYVHEQIAGKFQKQADLPAHTGNQI